MVKVTISPGRPKTMWQCLHEYLSVNIPITLNWFMGLPTGISKHVILPYTSYLDTYNSAIPQPPPPSKYLNPTLWKFSHSNNMDATPVQTPNRAQPQKFEPFWPKTPKKWVLWLIFIHVEDHIAKLLISNWKSCLGDEWRKVLKNAPITFMCMFIWIS